MSMKKNKETWILIVAFLVVFNVKGQNVSVLQKEIDFQVWRPFKEAFESMDGEMLNQLYAEDVLRVTPNGIDTHGAFKKANVVRFKERKQSGSKIMLDFWFESRNTNEDTSYEVGVFKIVTISGENESTVYGQFHIVLKKIDDQWLITQDWDNVLVNGKQLGADDFARKPPAQF